MFKPIFKMKLLVDKKKNKVVLAEACKDLVDVLFSFLLLPVGTIVRLLEKFQQNQKSQAVTIGCFNSLYKGVSGLGTDNFMTEACKQMLLYPRSEKRGRLKLRIDDTDVYGCYVCSNLYCPDTYSEFSTSRCSCGALMQSAPRRASIACDEIFVSDKTLFTITDKMEVGFITSMALTLKTLKDLGYTDADQLQEMVVDVDQEKVLALLDCLFSSDSPLTDVFLRKQSSYAITKTHNIQTLPFKEENGSGAESSNVITVKVFTRKLDKTLLYIESGKDFVDLLFTFLVIPLNSAWEMSGSNMVLGRIGNLCESFKNLSSSDGRNTFTGKCMLPWYYSCQRPLLDVYYGEPSGNWLKWRNNVERYFKPMDPRCDKVAGIEECSGFVKRGETFMVSDDLMITPMTLSSTICSLKKWNINFDDLEEQVVDISKVEAIRLLGASFMTSTALTTVFGSLLLKKPKEEKL